MSRKSKYLPLMIAKGLEVMLDALPQNVLNDPEKAQQALRKYRLRQDNHETSAFSDLLEELLTSMAIERLKRKDLVEMFVQLKIHFEQ
ncbi:MAG: hypothetical protein HY865_12585 [Chloroflexi bacterium]|jgi:hypothetical protein|nr:hypothetical protein [Chloroflexota bacterium]CAG0965923.1 hypothetical protein ANAEL_00904 [Anaerolineales bacterium]